MPSHLWPSWKLDTHESWGHMTFPGQTLKSKRNCQKGILCLQKIPAYSLLLWGGGTRVGWGWGCQQTQESFLPKAIKTGQTYVTPSDTESISNSALLPTETKARSFLQKARVKKDRGNCESNPQLLSRTEVGREERADWREDEGKLTVRGRQAPRRTLPDIPAPKEKSKRTTPWVDWQAGGRGGSSHTNLLDLFWTPTPRKV